MPHFTFEKIGNLEMQPFYGMVGMAYGELKKDDEFIIETVVMKSVDYGGCPMIL